MMKRYTKGLYYIRYSAKYRFLSSFFLSYYVHLLNCLVTALFCMMIIFKVNFFEKILSGIPSECQTFGSRLGPTFCRA